MPRFSKGTTDHDKDGRMGGSLKGDGTMARKPAAKKGAKAVTEANPAAASAPAESKSAAVDEQFAEADAKGEPKLSDEEAEAQRVAELQAGQAVRGY